MMGRPLVQTCQASRIMSKTLDRNLSLFPSVVEKKTVKVQWHGGRRNSLISLCLRVSIFMFVALLMFCSSLAWSATISGIVEIEGRKDKSGVLVTAQKDERESLSSITDRDGAYFIQDISSGSYTLTAQKAGCLVEVHSDVVVGSNPVIVNFQLIPGDLKIDNQINLLDRIMLTSGWEASEGAPNWNSMLDIYEDGVIDSKDRDLLLSHWKKFSDVKLGSLEVISEPEGAAILLNGADTGKTTPYTFQGMVVTIKYLVTLAIEGYPEQQAAAQLKADETMTIDLILDDQPPEFSNWIQDPANLTEDSQGRFRISVRVVDMGGSGLGDNKPQIDHRIGADTYDGYEDMTQESGDVWYYEIEEPRENWDAYRGKYVYYKAKIADVAGNEGESGEQSEEIDDENDLPIARITSTFNAWETGLLTVEAEASDPDSDGTIVGVLFEYSFDNASWTKIGSTDTAAPYSARWETTETVREVVKNVWIRATATDDDNGSHSDTKEIFGIDNQPPITSHNYDGAWHNENFIITLKADDEDGIGVASISYILNFGTKRDILINGQASAPVEITTESHDNVLEYWSVDELNNESSHRTLERIKLDKSDPEFSDWQQDPDDLNEDSTGAFRISVRVSDGDGSGLEDQIPQIDYSIGQDPLYDGYENMATADEKVWYFDIPEPKDTPTDTWNEHRGQYVHYKVKIKDIAENEREIAEKKLIKDINDPPLVDIISRYNTWEKGLLTIEATASDTDGKIAGVQFHYSSDGIEWKLIGPAVTRAPFLAEWDTTADIAHAESIQIQATATDDSGGSASSVYPGIGIDNQAPVTIISDYDTSWHVTDFEIILTVSDGNGIGVPDTNVKYKINDGDERSLSADGHPWITEEGKSQLEYWSVDELGNAESPHTLRDIKLDKTAPELMDWTHDPDITEDSTDSFIVSVRVEDENDEDGSGLEGEVPQFSYRIGRDSHYSEYEDMRKSEEVWYYEILVPENPANPEEPWNEYSGENIYYKVRAEDVAGNQIESQERWEKIEDINDSPVVNIVTTFSEWEKGSLTIEAESSDSDGFIAGVLFERSFNRIAWTPIETLVTRPPYSVVWNTETVIPGVEEEVWIKATVTDDDNKKVEYNTNSFGVDNQPPIITIEGYDNVWHNQDFAISLKPGDRNGIGVASVFYRLNSGEIQEESIKGQINIPVNITTEGANNNLEYWGVDLLGNESLPETLNNIKLDKTPPVISNWQEDPPNLTEDTPGAFRVSVEATDEGGSGLEGRTPQLDYHIGRGENYDGYENMTSGSWFFDIFLESPDTWNAHIDELVYYKVRIEDVAGNVTESQEVTELIDSVNDEPVVTITTTFDQWVSGKLTITATASDVDGPDSEPRVEFEYSVNGADWLPVGVTIASPPVYSAEWDTTIAIPDLAENVRIKAKAIDYDDDSVSVEDVIPKSFGVDNQPPALSNWIQIPADLTEDSENPLRVQVNVDDSPGSGVAEVVLSYRIAADRVIEPFNLMIKGAGNTWYYDIPEPNNPAPNDSWDGYRNEILYYSSYATDVVGNRSPQTVEQQELIDDINDAPDAVIRPNLNDWEMGILTIQANANDDDGEIETVQFQYSPDNVTWFNIGSILTDIPYTETWDSTVITMDPDVWLRVVVTDDDDESVQVPYSNTIGIDNISPTFANFDNTDLTEDSSDPFFRVEVEITDQGSGVDGTKVTLDYRIGTAGYTEYGMHRRTGTNVWFYEVPRSGLWSNHAGSTIFYRVRADDIVGNTAASDDPPNAEQREFIEPTTGSISGTISPEESWKFGSAKVAAHQNGQEIIQVPVSAVTGAYSIERMRPGSYDLVVTSTGYGADSSMTNIQVVAGGSSPNHNVTLYTFAVAELTSALGGSVEYKDSQLDSYELIVGANVLGQDGKVVLGVSDKEPTSVPNPEVSLMGRSIGVGYEGKILNEPLQLIMPRPDGITDPDAIMTFIYDGKDQSYRFVNRDDIATSDQTVTITITPEDVWNFSDDNHDFDEKLSRTLDTVFYVLITKFNEPASSQTGILVPQFFSSGVSYIQPNISAVEQTIAVVVHGITSTTADLEELIDDIQAINYYDHVLVFNYDAQNSIGSNGDFFLSELADMADVFDGKVDVIAHGMGGLVARRAITTGGDTYIGSLTMLGVPHGGVDERLLKAGFADFLMKTDSNPTWTYYRTGWRDMLTNSTFLLALNSQSAGQVNTFYYGIAASDPSALTDNDGLLYLASQNFMTGFLSMEQPLPPKAFEAIPVNPPASEGPGFMSGTRHVAMLDSDTISNRVTTYLLGNSRNIEYERYDGDLIPGDTLEAFTVVLENTGTETVFGVTAQLSTLNSSIHNYSDVQGIENDTANFGDIPAGATGSGAFSFKINPSAPFGSSVVFNLLIRNSRDNSIAEEQFIATIGGDMIKIDLAPIPNVTQDTSDGDPAAEPGEVISMDITMRNQSAAIISSVVVTLKTDDTRVQGLDAGDNPVDLANVGIPVSYDTFFGNAIKFKTFQFVKIKDDFTPLGSMVHFTLEIHSDGSFFGSDEFDIKIGADIIADNFDPNDNLIPGGGPEDIDVDVRNITGVDIPEVKVKIDFDEDDMVVITGSDNDFDLTVDEEEFDPLAAGDTEAVTFEADIDAGFAGYVVFTIEIEVDNDLINVETFRHYFGRHAFYATNWIVTDDNNNDLPDPGEEIEFQIALRNLTDEATTDVETILDTTDTDVVTIVSFRDDGDYNIPAHGVELSDNEYEFTIANAGDISVSGETTNLGTDTLEYPDAMWIPDALIGGILTLNPSGSADSYTITGNTETTITVDLEAGAKPDVDVAALDDDPFEVTMPTDDPFTEFQLRGREVEFTLDISEDNDLLDQETFRLRIGGMVRHMPWTSYNDLLSAIDDRESLGPLNNGNGIPELGEFIELDITLVNIWSDDIDNVEATLIAPNSDIDFPDSGDDEANYSDMNDGSNKTRTFKFEIEDSFEGDRITFRLDIIGDVNGSNNVDLGTDEFTIPIGQ